MKLQPIDLMPEYSDKRHPDEVKYAKKIEDDLSQEGFYSECHGHGRKKESY